MRERLYKVPNERQELQIISKTIESHVWKSVDGLRNKAAKCRPVSNISAYNAQGKASEMIHGRNILISAALQKVNEMMRLQSITILTLYYILNS